MTQRDIFYKWLFYALAGVLWAVIQQLVLNRLDFWGGVHPFVLPLVPVMGLYSRLIAKSWLGLTA